MRLHFTIVFAVLLVGCQSPQGLRDLPDDIGIAIEEPSITAEGARHIVLDLIDRAKQTVQAHAADGGEHRRTHLEILAKQERRLGSNLESLLSLSRKGDELRIYKTEMTADGRGGKTGFVLMRGNRIVGQMVLMNFDGSLGD